MTPLDDLDIASETLALRRLVGGLLPPGEAEDAVQEAFAKTLDTRGPLRAPRSWLAAVAQRRARDQRRAALRRAQRERAVARPEAQDLRAREELLRDVVRELFALPPVQRDAVVARYLDDEPPRVTAARLGVPVPTIKKRVQRGLETLRSRLDARPGGRASWVALLLPMTLWRQSLSLSTVVLGTLALLVVTFGGWLAMQDTAPPVTTPGVDRPVPASVAEERSSSPLQTSPFSALRPDAPKEGLLFPRTITGRVLLPGRHPLADAQVQLGDAWGRVLATARGDAEGRFELVHDGGRGGRLRVVVRDARGVGVRTLGFGQSEDRHVAIGDLLLDPVVALEGKGEGATSWRWWLHQRPGGIGRPGGFLGQAEGSRIDALPAGPLLVLIEREDGQVATLPLDLVRGTVAPVAPTFAAPRWCTLRGTLAEQDDLRMEAILRVPGAGDGRALAMPLPEGPAAAGMRRWRLPSNVVLVELVLRGPNGFEHRSDDLTEPVLWTLDVPRERTARSLPPADETAPPLVFVHGCDEGGRVLETLRVLRSEGRTSLPRWAPATRHLRLLRADGSTATCRATAEALAAWSSLEWSPAVLHRWQIVDETGAPLSGCPIEIEDPTVRGWASPTVRSDQDGLVQLRLPVGFEGILRGPGGMKLDPEAARHAHAPARVVCPAPRLLPLRVVAHGAPRLPDRWWWQGANGSLEVLEEDPITGDVLLRWWSTSGKEEAVVQARADHGVDHTLRWSGLHPAPLVWDWTPNPTLEVVLQAPRDGRVNLSLEREDPALGLYIGARSGTPDRIEGGVLHYEDLAPGRYRLHDVESGAECGPFLHPRPSGAARPALDLSAAGPVIVRLLGEGVSEQALRDAPLRATLEGGREAWVATVPDDPALRVVRHAGHGVVRLHLDEAALEALGTMPVLTRPGEDHAVRVRLRGGRLLRCEPPLDDDTLVTVQGVGGRVADYRRELRAEGGVLRITGLPAGPHRLLLNAPDRPPREVVLDVADAEVPMLAWPVGHELLITLRHEGAVPEGTWTVFARQTGRWPLGRTAVVLPDGRLALRGLRAGPVSLTLRRLTPAGRPDADRVATIGSAASTLLTWELE